MPGIIEDARKNGELVYEFDQSASAVLTQPGPWGDAYSGFCAGFAMKWLSLRQKGNDYDYDKTTRKMIMPHWHSTRDQNVYEDQDYNKALEPYGLKISADTNHWTGAPSASNLRKIAQGTNGLYLIRLRREGGGHAVAMHSEVEKKSYRFADANYGSFHLLSAERFEQWLTEFLQVSGYINRYTKEGWAYRLV